MRRQVRPLHPARPLPDVTVGPTAEPVVLWGHVLLAFAVLGALCLVVLVVGGFEMLGVGW